MFSSIMFLIVASIILFLYQENCIILERLFLCHTYLSSFSYTIADKHTCKNSVPFITLMSKIRSAVIQALQFQNSYQVIESLDLEARLLGVHLSNAG